MRKINQIILHCTATLQGADYRASDIDKWHKNNGWAGIGYHYVIDIDGKVEFGRKVSQQGAHCSGRNANSIGIVYVGGMNGVKPIDTRTRSQKVAMYRLVRGIIELLGLSINDVNCHNEYANKACPCFEIEEFRKEYREYWEEEQKR